MPVQVPVRPETSLRTVHYFDRKDVSGIACGKWVTKAAVSREVGEVTCPECLSVLKIVHERIYRAFRREDGQLVCEALTQANPDEGPLFQEWIP